MDNIAKLVRDRRIVTEPDTEYADFHKIVPETLYTNEDLEAWTAGLGL